MTDTLSLPIDSIIVEREDRQRRDLTDIEDLAESISARGLFHPIIIDDENVLIAGERRLAAMKHLGWTHALARRFSDLSPVDAQLIELEENIKRASLPWQDRVRTVARLVRLVRNVEPSASFESIAKRIGFNYTTLVRMFHLAEEIERGNERVLSASSWNAAYGHVSRKFERDVATEVESALALGKEEKDVRPQADRQTASPDDEEEHPSDGEGLREDDADGVGPPPSPTVSGIYPLSFIEWAPSYSGLRFNLIHCDFPYGIDHQDSDQGRSAMWGGYSDSEDTYWHLLDVFASEREAFMANSCHIMFWLSTKHLARTLEFFADEVPEVEWWPSPLIWHKTDNRGIVSDHTRGPRHIYEVCLLGRRNDRKILKVVSDCYGAPTGKKSHLSEKPEPMLRHFLSMMVDENTRILDPTAGSGSALRAADSLGAEFCLGLEIDHETAEDANKRFLSASGLRKLSEAAS